jgi:demethylmenaquinone methyltransferase/2-methoxy-6-polyprenyl-1,4-benzoquinol methylase
MKKYLTVALLLGLLVFAIPIEHKYDKLFRFFSVTLIPQGLEISKGYDKKIYFYVSDLIALLLLVMGCTAKRFFRNPLWIIFGCATASIIASPFIHYPVAYTRLLHLLTPIVLFSFLSTAFNDEERSKTTRLMLSTFVFAGLLQTAIGIVQYFHQAPLGLRILGEATSLTSFPMQLGKRWIFDQALIYVGPIKHIMRASGTLPHANVYGGFLALSILATYYLATKVKSWSYTIPLQFFALMLSYSRSALFGLALGTGLWFALMLYKKQRVQFLALIVAISLGISGILLYEQINGRGGVVNYNYVAQASDEVRIQQHNVAFEVIKHNPFFGLGLNQFSERATPYFSQDANIDARLTAPHNIFLFLACETGLISLGAFLFFIGTLLLRAFRTPFSVEKTTLSAIFIAFLFIGCCDFYPILFQQGKLMFFSIAGLLAAYVSQRKPIADPSRQEVWKMFDSISSTYDRTNRILSLGMDQRWRKSVAHFLPLRTQLKILDLATGTGDQISALLKSNASIQSVTGIDLSSEMLEIAKKKLSGKADFLLADAEKLPFADASFDAATFSFGIRNVTDPLVSLKDIHRILKPSGRCLILEFSLPPQPIRALYLLYLRHLLPRIGGLISRNPAAYRYLNQTIEHFPSGKDFSALMGKAGFQRLSRVSMSLGGVTLYVGEKQ